MGNKRYFVVVSLTKVFKVLQQYLCDVFELFSVILMEVAFNIYVLTKPDYHFIFMVVTITE
jgi:hypothetical protein